MALVGRVSALGGVPPTSARCCSPTVGCICCCSPERALPGCPTDCSGAQLGRGRAGVWGLTARGVPRCERYGVVPLARMVQQSQYHYSLPAEETGSPAVQPLGKGRKSSRAGRKRLRQGLGQNPGLRQAWRPLTAQQSRGPGTLSPASTRDKAEPTTRHPAAQWGLEPGPPTAMTVLEQDLAGGRRAPGGAQQGAGGSAHPACTACPRDGSMGSSRAAERCGATPVPAVERRRQQGESVLGAEPAPQLGRPQASARWRHVLAVPLTAPLSSGPGRLCRSYKHLDKCQHQIAPCEVKYQLHNKGTRTLFHCNCTRRCASRRKRQGFSHHHGHGVRIVWDPVGCPLWPAAADCCPPAPAGWGGSCTGRGTSVTWRWLSWLTASPRSALFWSRPLTAARVRGHSTSKCRRVKGTWPAWGFLPCVGRRDALVGPSAVLQAWHEAGFASIIPCSAVP